MDQDAINLAKAIRQRESGGNFNATGDNGTSSGAYQWQAPTWKAHAQEILGDPNAEMTPANQNAVAYGMIKKWKDSGLNVAQIAAKWNSGSENGWENKIGTTNINGKDIQYNVPEYVKSVTENYQKIKLESQGQQVTQNPQQPQEQTSVLQDIGTKAKETLLDPFTSRFSNIDYNNQGITSNILQSVGAVAGGITDVAGKALLEGAKVLTPKPVEQAVGSVANSISSGISSAIPDSTKQALSDWAQQHPEASANLGAIIDIGSLIPLSKSVGAVKTALGIGADASLAETSASRILQATKPTLEKTKLAVNAYENIPLDKVKTYSDLERVLQQQNATDLAKVTSELSKDTTKYRLQNFDIAKEGITFNPVKDAISSLNELGKKTSDTALLGKVRQFEIKLSQGQMTQNDVNELAKLLGSKKSAFKQSGELLKSTNAVKSENTRTALKEIARTGMSEDVANLDRAVSNRIEIANLAKRMSERVAKEVNKAEQTGVFKKLIGFGLKTADLLSGRILSTAIRELTRRGTLSAVELEKELVKNLKIIQQINQTKDVNKAREFLKSIGYFTGSQIINVQSDKPKE